MDPDEIPKRRGVGSWSISLQCQTVLMQIGWIMVHFITVSNSVDADQARYFCSTCLQRLPADVTSWQRIPTTDDTSIYRVKLSTIYVKQCGPRSDATKCG